MLLEKVGMTTNCSFSLFTNSNFSLLVSELIMADMSFVAMHSIPLNRIKHPQHAGHYTEDSQAELFPLVFTV